MSITIHIPFYNPYPEKKEGYRNLTRFEYLLENLDNLKKLPVESYIFVHTHNNFLEKKKIPSKVIKHDIADEDLHKGYLTWRVRSLMESQKNLYKYYMYLEHDIKFSRDNFLYWLDYNKIISKNNFNLGFLIYEQNHNDGSKYSIHLMKKFYQYITINNQKFYISDFDNYCCFWIYENHQFNKFVNTKWWKFKKPLNNFRHYYGVTERSALGMHALNINYFKATILPASGNTLDQRCFIEHITNNYFNKFNVSNSNDSGLSNVCKYKINEIIEEKKEQEKISFFPTFNSLLRKIKWKLRFIKKINIIFRKIKKI